jgi:hypothetical protein
MAYYYTYYSYEEWGRGYIGSRKSKVSPEQDTKYFGSFKDKTFKPTQKIILTTHQTREEALAAEMRLHEFYDVAHNSHFANQAKQTSEKFYVPTERAKKNGRKSQKIQKQLNIGIYALTQEEHQEKGKKAYETQRQLGIGLAGLTKEQRVKNAENAGNKVHELGLGIHALSREERSEIGKNGNKKLRELGLGIYAQTPEQKSQAGKKCHELGLGVHGRTKEERIEHGKKGGKRSKELNRGIFALTKEQRLENAKKGRQIAAKNREREFVLMDPHGNIHKGKNLDKFCRDHNLNPANTRNVLNGTRPHHKGWTKPIDNTLTDILFS